MNMLMNHILWPWVTPTVDLQAAKSKVFLKCPGEGRGRFIHTFPLVRWLGCVAGIGLWLTVTCLLWKFPHQYYLIHITEQPWAAWGQRISLSFPASSPMLNGKHLLHVFSPIPHWPRSNCGTPLRAPLHSPRVTEYSKACVQQLPLPHWKKINRSKLPCGVTAPGGLSQAERLPLQVPPPLCLCYSFAGQGFLTLP